MTIDNIIEKFDQPNDFQNQKSTEKKTKSVCIANTKKLASTFFGSRWMGLVIGPAYGLFLYLYVTHLILGGPPFTIKGGTNGTEAANTSVLIKDLKKSLSIKDEPDFEPLMSRKTSHFIGLGVGGGTGIALTAYSLFSTEVRCSMVLMVPSLLTKRGRGFMLTFVTSLVIEGPVNTIEHNLQEVVRSFTCMYEHIKSLSERFREQFLSLMKQVKGMLQEVEDMVNKYKEAIKKMLTDATADQRRQIEEAKADLERQSEKIKEAAKKISGVLNAPGNILSGVCGGASKLAEGAWNGIKDVGKAIGGFFGKRRKRGACKIPGLVDIPGVKVPDIGIDKLKNILKTLKPDLDFIDFDYDSLLGQIESSSISEIRNQLKAIFKQALKFGKVIATWWSKIFYLTIIFVVIDAIKYQRKHFADDGFDNMLIDDNLKKAWRRDGKRKLTPIRKWEAKERYQVATSIKLSKKEIKKIVLESIPSIIITIIIIGVVLTDLVFAEVLQTFQEHAKFGISFPGMEQGVSFSSMIKDTDAKLNILKIEAFDLRTDPCLPKAKMTPPSILVPIILILLFCAISCIVDAYATRLRAIICNFFHPGRADERANFLYKKIQSGRRNRYHQFHLILSRELGRRERTRQYFPAWIIWIKDKLPIKAEGDMCPGCDGKLEDTALVNIKHNGEARTVTVCGDCMKDPSV